MRSTNCKGYRVVRDKKGKTTLEKILFYGRDCSVPIRARTSKKVKPLRQGELALHLKFK